MHKPMRMVGVAYGIVCVVWGSTYLAIRIGVQDVPPALFAAVRFLIAGAVLLAITQALGRPMPRRPAEWVTNGVAGVLMLGAANGLVVWAEQYVASGVAAIIIVTVSLWMALFDSIIPGSRARPTPLQALGLVIGFAGTILLVGSDLGELRRADWRGPIALTVASAAWALGSIWLQRRPSAGGPYVSAAIQMLAGGLALLAVGTVRGEWPLMSFSVPGVASVAYLAIFGSIVAFTAYVYVLQHWPATVAGTYVYVNTVVAVVLGWLVLREPITARTVLSMAVVMTAVVWVRRAGRRGDGVADAETGARRLETARRPPRPPSVARVGGLTVERTRGRAG